MTQEPDKLERVVAVRDSKDPDGLILFVRPSAWVDLLDQIKAGEHRLPKSHQEGLDERLARPAEEM
jgi:hypothetical protein